MRKVKNAISLGISALIVIALIIIVGFGAYLNDTFNTSTTGRSVSIASTSSASTPLASSTSLYTNLISNTTATFSTLSTSGLELEILTNSTAIQDNENLGVQIALVNTLNQNLSLLMNMSAINNIANWDSYANTCGLSSVEHTFGFALFPGHVTNANISIAGNPMLLGPPVATSCPNRFYNTGYIQNVIFEPNSHVAALYANASFSDDFERETLNMLINASTQQCRTSPYSANESGYYVTSENGTTTTVSTSSSGTDLSFGCGYGSAINGYWTMPASGSYLVPNMRSNSTIMSFLSNLYQNYFHLFPPGSYTIVAQDIWNQTVYGYFNVVKSSIDVSQTTSNTNTMTTTTTTYCLQPTGIPVGCATMTTSSSESRSVATSIDCTISAEPTGFYLHVITDGTPKPIQGAVLNATAVSSCGNYTSSQILKTNSTGWAKVPVPEISGNYFIIFQVQYTNSTTGETYTKVINQVGWGPEQGTFVTLSFPSGTVNFSGLFPISCNGECYYMNIPQFVTIVRTEPTPVTYSVQLFTNNTLKSPSITNVTLLTVPTNQTQLLEFYVPYPSYVFAGPSSFPATNTNSSSFYLVSYPGGAIIPTTYYKAGNLLYTAEQVQGWIEIYSTAM